MNKKNPFEKITDKDNPYATYHDPLLDITHKVLKTYEHREIEYKNPYALWFVDSKSPLPFGEWGSRDAIAQRIIEGCNLVSACDDWKKTYGN